MDPDLTISDDFIMKPQKRVKIYFPRDPSSLAKLLDWMYNSGDFATTYMDEDTIKKAGLFTDVIEVEE